MYNLRCKLTTETLLVDMFCDETAKLIIAVIIANFIGRGTRQSCVYMLRYISVFIIL